MKKIVLVDGNNLLFRSFYATAYQGVIMKNSKGFPTNALYGFINMMNKIIKEENPSYIMVAFDKGKTFRHDKYESYKAGRAAMPDELILQFPKAKELLDSMGIKHFEIYNYEADDIIGTLSKMIDNEDEFIGTIISSDKDLLQLISDEVNVKLLKQSGYIMMDKKEFYNTYKTEPIKMIDLKALMGDPSDHIPGVKGIGEKTAISLISKYGSLDGVYNNLDDISLKTREKLINDKENAYMSYDIATIYKDVDLGFDLEDCKYNGYKVEDFKKQLEDLEFYSLLKKIDFPSLENNTVSKKEDNNISIKDIKDFSNKNFSFYIETRGEVYSKSEILGIGIYDGENGYFLNVEDISKYKDLFNNKLDKYTYDLKKNIVVLNNFNVNISNCNYDSMIACYLLDYVVKDDISFVARIFDVEIPSYDEVFGTLKRPKEVSLDTLKEICVKKAKFIYDTKDEIINKLKEEKEDELFNNIEMPLTVVLADMELTGIRIDKDYLKRVGKELEDKMVSVEKEIYDLSGVQFNIMSPAQLSDVLFNKLEIKYPKRVKDNKYSTSKDILDKIVDEHPIVLKVLEYRTLTKLYSNYVVGLLEEVREDGKIHTIFTQTLTRTGRLSSISPNLQNIPARSEYSKLIRQAFIPEENSLLLSSDYSQVELRVFAHIANATNMIQAFIDDKDIHAKTASDIYHVPIEKVTKNMRRTAKAVNFGILYGISSFGLSEDLGIDLKTAKKFIDDYLDTFPGISEYMEKAKEDAYKNGYVRTLMNRKRVIEELKNRNFMIRSSGERMALNTPIQGTAADILKKAMVEIYNEFNKRGLKSKMLIQVHDELVFNVLNDELETVKEIVRDIMENTFKLKVPLKVDIEYGKNWYEAK